MKSIKEIDLLNKIANGEKIPKKIKTPSGLVLTYDEDLKNYFNEDFDITLFDKGVGQELDLELEIIEEDKKIEKIDVLCLAPMIQSKKTLGKQVEESNLILCRKINEIIDCINYINKENK